MTIKFHCEHCRRLVQAPDSAGGRRGTCPHCQGSNFIPAGDVEELDITPLDEKEERHRKRTIETLMDAERDILAESANPEKTPRLGQRDPEDIEPEDLYHLVVNYCLDMAAGNLERADDHAYKLNEHSGTNRRAVSDFQTGKALEPSLDTIPVKVLQGFLKDLMTKMR